MNALQFGYYLQQTRKVQKLSLRKLEALSGVSNSYLSQVETGKRGIPSPEFLRKIAIPLGVSYEELLEKAGYIDQPASQPSNPACQTQDLVDLFKNANLTFKGHELSENQKKTMLSFVQTLITMSEEDQL